MIKITEKHLKKFIEMASDSLMGDWLIVGGTVLPLMGITHRATVDIDVVPFYSATTEDVLKLMQIAEKVGLSIESINQAAAFFVNKIPNWKKRCKLLHEGKKCRMYIPQLDLFLELKLARFTQSDFEDCLQYIKHAKNDCNLKNCLKILDKKIKQTENSDKHDWMTVLRKALGVP